MKAKVVINGAGVREVLHSSGVQAILQDKIDKAQSMCGDGYVADIQPGKNRPHAMVKTVTAKAARSNAKHNTLVKAFGAIGGK